ncbi:MAG TPA: hypothetical protein ENJ79_07840 [Gammaproteobacteria bacterium]|nr:hypothetical protein [Gammaproteobacteria bacterium]
MGDVVRSLSANAGEDIAKAGNFILVQSADAPVRVIIDGETSTMSQGDRRVMHQGFRGFRIENTSSSTNNVTLQVGFGDFRPAAISGSVAVSSMPTKRYHEYEPSFQDYAFAVALESPTPAAGEFSFVVLENPTGSGLLAAVHAVTIANRSGVAEEFLLHLVPLLPGGSIAQRNPKSKYLGSSAGPPNAILGYGGVNTAGASLRQLLFRLAADETKRFQFDNPFIIGEGYFLSCWARTDGVGAFAASFELVEVSA